MKIIYLTTESYYREPIIKSQVESLILSLLDKGLNIELVTFENADSREYFENGYKHHQFKFRGHLFNMVALMFYAFKIAQKGDVIHVRSYPPMFAALFVKIWYGNKVIFDPRGLWPEEMSYFKKKPVITFLFKLFERLFCYASDSIVVVSNKFFDLFSTRYPKLNNKIIVIPTFSIPLPNTSNVVNVKNDIFKNENVEIFVYSGSFETWQKIEEIVDYFKFLEKNYSSARFLFLSKSKDMFNDYLSKKLDSNKYTVLSANYNEVGSFLMQCDYGVIFRDFHIINKVSAPIKIKDYLMANLKLIASDNIGDSSELIKNNNLGFILEDFSLDSKSKSLLYLNGSDRVEGKGYKTDEQIIKSFSLSSISNMYYNLYVNLQ